MRFVEDGGDAVVGVCENLSESGLLALFVVPPDIWVEGHIDLQFGTGLLGIPARVARVIGMRAGFAFPLASEEHRGKLREMMRAARENDGPVDHL